MPARVEKCCARVRQRWILVLMCFLGLVNAFAMRSCLSIAITEMVAPVVAAKNVTDDTNLSMETLKLPTNTTKQRLIRKYNWDESTQGYILSSFYWGYVLTQLPGGILAQNFGGKYFLGIGILMTAIFTILTPLGVYYGEETALIILRVLMGLFEGVSYPSINALLGKWVPPEERSRAGSFVYSGGFIGSMVGVLIPGWILQYSEMGWPLVFYSIGAIGVVWFCVWQLSCYNSPSDHPYVSQFEVKYLLEKMSKHTRNSNGPLSVPWRHVVKSKAMWALLFGLIGFSSLSLTLVSYLPKYMSGVLKFSVEYNGYLTAMIFMSMCVASTVFSWIADFLISKRGVSITLVRKAFSVVSLTVSGMFLVAASYAGCDRFLAVVFFVASLMSLGAGFSGIMVNNLDLSPNYAGTLTGITNGLGVNSGIIIPIIIGKLTPTQGLSEWNVVFWMMFGIALICNVIFLLFGSGEVEYWNDPRFNKTELNIVSTKDDGQ